MEITDRGQWKRNIDLLVTWSGGFGILFLLFLGAKTADQRYGDSGETTFMTILFVVWAITGLILTASYYVFERFLLTRKIWMGGIPLENAWLRYRWNNPPLVGSVLLNKDSGEIVCSIEPLFFWRWEPYLKSLVVKPCLLFADIKKKTGNENAFRPISVAISLSLDISNAAAIKAFTDKGILMTWPTEAERAFENVDLGKVFDQILDRAGTLERLMPLPTIGRHQVKFKELLIAELKPLLPDGINIVGEVRFS